MATDRVDKSLEARAARDHALGDMQVLMRESATMRQLASAGILVSRLFHKIVAARQSELIDGWDVTNPILVDGAVSLFVETKGKEAMTAAELQVQLFEQLIPVVDVLVQIEEANKNKETVDDK